MFSSSLFPWRFSQWKQHTWLAHKIIAAPWVYASVFWCNRQFTHILVSHCYMQLTVAFMQCAMCIMILKHIERSNRRLSAVTQWIYIWNIFVALVSFVQNAELFNCYFILSVECNAWRPWHNNLHRCDSSSAKLDFLHLVATFPFS